MKIRWIALILLLAGFAFADDGPAQSLDTSPVITALQQKLKAGDANAIAAFWVDVANRTTPVVEPAADPDHVIVTFLWRAPQANTVVLAAQLGRTRDMSDLRLAHIPDTDVWFKAYRMRPDMRLSYGFLVDAKYLNMVSGPVKRDPLSAHQFADRSYFELPKAPPQSWFQPRPGTPAGKVSGNYVPSKLLDRHYISTYLPPNYDPKAKPYPLLICFYGSQYLSKTDGMAAAVTLDNLIAARKIAPPVAIFIDDPDGEGNEELRNHRSFLDFMVQEILPWAHQQWNVTSDPRRTTLCGASAGGLASGYLAVMRPDLFGNVLSESGAFWRPNEGGDTDFEFVKQQVEKSPKMPIRWVLQVGAVELMPTPNDGPSLNGANKHLRDALLAKGYEVHFTEEASGHEPVGWRGGFADGLILLAPPRRSDRVAPGVDRFFRRVRASARTLTARRSSGFSR